MSEKLKRLRRAFGDELPEEVLELKDLTSRELEDEERKQASEAMAKWLNQRIGEQYDTMVSKRIHWSRNRLFKQGHQWITTRDAKTWRELDSHTQRIRAVVNHIGPALRFRRALLEEQRPGWRAEPVPGHGVSGRETAEAQQSVVEWYYRKQKVFQQMLDAATHAQTDAVSFLQVYVDKDLAKEEMRLIPRGDARYESFKAQGFQETPAGVLAQVDDADLAKRTVSTGEDIKTRVVEGWFVYADAEAITINGPESPARWLAILRPRDLQSAQQELGDVELEADDGVYTHLPGLHPHELDKFNKGLPPYPESREYRSGDMVWDAMVYLRHKDLPDGGLWYRTLGGYLMESGKLPDGLIPVIAVRDGSDDPDLFPGPVMSDWIGPQMALNAAFSKILEYMRNRAGTTLLALKDTLIQESYTSGSSVVLEYQGQKPDMMPPNRVSPDMWNTIQYLQSTLEDLHGWNDLARGKVAGDSVQGFQDVSGRAVLGAQEMFERQFGPMIRAMASAASNWAEVVVAYARELFTTPRMIPMASRPDLAKRLDKTNLGSGCGVTMDPATLMPMPRALRNQMLQDMVQQGMIPLETYRENSPFAEVRNVRMGSTPQWERAQWVNTVLEDRAEELMDADPIYLYDPSTGLGVFWQDDPQTHMRALNELVLDERKSWSARKLAADRWGVYADLDRSKNFPMELELQGLPRPVAPAEAIGVPNSVPQHQTPQEQQRPQAASGQGNVPGQAAQPGSSPTPEMAGPGSTRGSTQSPQPLGTVGRAEQRLGQ